MQLRNRRLVEALTWLLACAAPALGHACACGCGVFDVGTSSMFPTRTGGMLFVEEDYMDQDQNWSGTSSAPADANDDKRIRTFFTTLGAQYLFNRSWGAMIEVPYWDRSLTTTLADGSIGTFDHAALGDVRLKGIYSGFSADLSSGITFGLKLPTGDSTYPHFDPDTEIGSGSTDLLLGGYQLGSLTADNRWSWFANLQWQQPLWHKESYRPGAELDAAAGIYYGALTLGTLRVTPIVQLELTWRGHDGGPEGDPVNTGYTRAYAAPGVELDVAEWRIYADVGLPFYTNASGNQLMAPAVFKVNVSYHF
ncbi:MAG TPA: hypothetical protein VEG26_01735 [Steroidobacteraceae bacterium]|nr:hypothetical protein [Steroidobacteraceae bacterium]